MRREPALLQANRQPAYPYPIIVLNQHPMAMLFGRVRRQGGLRLAIPRTGGPIRVAGKAAIDAASRSASFVPPRRHSRRRLSVQFAGLLLLGLVVPCAQRHGLTQRAIHPADEVLGVLPRTN